MRYAQRGGGSRPSFEHSLCCEPLSVQMRTAVRDIPPTIYRRRDLSLFVASRFLVHLRHADPVGGDRLADL